MSHENLTFYIIIGLVLWLFAVLRSYESIEVPSMLLGLLICALAWPLIILTALISITRKNDNS